MDQLEHDDFEDTSEDFEFVISPDGELKSIVFPPEYVDSPPECVQFILELFGIDDIKDLVTRVLH